MTSSHFQRLGTRAYGINALKTDGIGQARILAYHFNIHFMISSSLYGSYCPT